jgi:transmembrane protein EpsG
MIGTLIFNIIAVFFAWLESSGRYKHGLKLSLFTVFVFLALRYDFGNDYMNYLDSFSDINSYSFFDTTLLSTKNVEWGWIYLNRIFGPLGFFAMIAVLAAFTSFILFRFIKKYVPSQYYWFAVFLYVFSPYHMLVLSSAMRQAVAVVLFLLAIDFIVQKEVVKYLIIISIATLFHASAGFLFPLFLLGFFKQQIKFRYILIILTLFALTVINYKEFFKPIEIITNEYFQFYSSYIKGADYEVKLGLGFVLQLMIYIVLLFFSQYDTDERNNVLYRIFVISLLISPIGMVTSMAGRFDFYLLPVMMAVFPIIFTRIKKADLRLGYICIIILLTIYSFYVFFQADVWKISFGEYRTIFSAPQIY